MDTQEQQKQVDKKRSLKIGVDIDEVLAEQLDSLAKFYEEEKGVFIPKEKFHTYYWPEV